MSNYKKRESTFFLKNDIKIYHNEYKRDIQCGKGIFYYEDRYTLESDFNQTGFCTGIKG